MARHLTFTWWGTETDPPGERMDIDFDVVKYVIYSLEEGEKCKRLHLQGYAQFHKKVRWATAARALCIPGAHFETPIEDSDVNTRYCSKERTHVDGPWYGGEPDYMGKRNDLKTAARLVQEGRIKDVAATTYVMYNKGLQALALRDAKPRKEKPNVTVLWGPTGVGKSFKANTLCPDAYWHPGGPWYDGYVAGNDLIIDEFDPKQWDVNHVLRLLDWTPLRVPFKGGYHQFNSPKIVITSHFDPEKWYPDRKEEMMRRITKVEHLVEAPPGAT